MSEIEERFRKGEREKKKIKIKFRKSKIKKKRGILMGKEQRDQPCLCCCCPRRTIQVRSLYGTWLPGRTARFFLIIWVSGSSFLSEFPVFLPVLPLPSTKGSSCGHGGNRAAPMGGKSYHPQYSLIPPKILLSQPLRDVLYSGRTIPY